MHVAVLPAAAWYQSVNLWCKVAKWMFWFIFDYVKMTELCLFMVYLALLLTQN